MFRSFLGNLPNLYCLTTYPTAWRLIDALPEGEGRSVFFLATMGGGMQGPAAGSVIIRAA